MTGLEEKRISYVMKNKDPSKIKRVSEYSALNEVYADKIRKIYEEIKTKTNELSAVEIDLKNSSETKAAEIITSVKKKLGNVKSHLMEAMNALV